MIFKDDTEDDLNLVKPNCKIILDACKTGQNGKTSIAAKIAKANLGCKVYASDESIKGLRMDQDDQVFFEGVNNVRFESYNSFTFFCKDKNSEVVIKENNPKSKGWKLF